MKIRLDQIEARLQALIEGSLAIFARGDAQHRLAHQLVQAVQRHLTTGTDGRTFAPDEYTIYLHPDSLVYWKQHRSLLDEIGDSLREAAREYGIEFRKDPHLRLTPNPSLPLEGIQVDVANRADSVGHTAVNKPGQGGDNKTLPANAYLIVDGSRIFPLISTVINIGRRNDNHLILPDPRVSRTPVQIRAVRGQYVLFDLNSTGGTMVNGRAIHQYTLKPGDVISLSGVPLIYGEDNPPVLDDDQAGSTQTYQVKPGYPPEIIE